MTKLITVENPSIGSGTWCGDAAKGGYYNIRVPASIPSARGYSIDFQVWAWATIVFAYS